MSDYYGILGVHPEASLREIKSAFRKKAKIHHPDSEHGVAETMRLLLEAYRILCDPVLRREYDRGKLRIIRNREDVTFDYRLWLKERLNDYEYVAKLIFYDLLHGFEDEALALYDTIRTVDEARMERFFERNESMDAEYCIAEEYAARGRLDDSFSVFSKLIKMEQQQRGFGYFYEVVLIRLKKLVLDDFPKLLEPDAMLILLEKAIALASSSENNASFLKRKSELLYKAGFLSEATEVMKKARQFNPKISSMGTDAKKKKRTPVKLARENRHLDK